MKKVQISSIVPQSGYKPEYVASLVKTINCYKEKDVSISLTCVESFGDDGLGFSKLITQSYLDNVDKLFLIKPNICWSTEDFGYLLNSSKDVIGAPVLGPNGYKVSFNYVNKELDEKSKEVKVNAVWADFICLSKKVIADLCESHPNTCYGAETFKCILDAETGFETLSADERLMRKVTQLGYTPWVSLSSRVKSFYFSKFDSNFETYLRELESRS